MENGPFINGLPIKNGDFPWLCQVTKGYHYPIKHRYLDTYLNNYPINHDYPIIAMISSYHYHP
jgi:hypothetical protein